MSIQSQLFSEDSQYFQYCNFKKDNRNHNLHVITEIRGHSMHTNWHNCQNITKTKPVAFVVEFLLIQTTEQIITTINDLT